MIKTRLALPVLAAAAALALFAGCGGGGDESSSSDPATIAPPDSGLFVEGAVRPGGSLKADVESLAENIAGVDDLGETIVSEIEKTAEADGEPFDYSEEVEPWLGEKGGAALGGYDGDNFSKVVVALQSTDTGATQEFIDTLSEESDEKVKEGSYEGIDFKIEPDSGAVVGVVGDFLVFTGDEASFKEAIDASQGESLSEVDSFTSVASHAPSGSLADVYADIGALVEEAGNEVDPQTEQVLQAAGIEIGEAVALLSVVPGSDSFEIDIASDPGKELVAPGGRRAARIDAGRFVRRSRPSEYGERLRKISIARRAGHSRHDRTARTEEHPEEGRNRPGRTDRADRRSGGLRVRCRTQHARRRCRARPPRTRARPRTRSPTSACCCGPATPPA